MLGEIVLYILIALSVIYAGTAPVSLAYWLTRHRGENVRQKALLGAWLGTFAFVMLTVLLYTRH